MPAPSPIDYDRSTLGVGIVHFGVGNFHRAHQARYVDDLARRGLADGWGICGVGVLPSDARMRDAMRATDGVHTLIEQDPSGARTARRIGSITRYLYAPEQLEEVLDVLAAPTTRIVSLTITEGGYGHAAEPTVGAPTVFDIVVEGMERRRAAGVPPFTVLSCDNLPDNGHVAREAFAAAADRRDPGLGTWVRESVAFPSTMVDRITPATTDAHRAIARDEFGVDEPWPVLSESFLQWVIEDDFPAGRPPFEEAGAQLVADVRPYELAKLRILNAGHQALAYFGLLSGHEYAHEAVGDAVVRDAVTAYMLEAQTTLDPVLDLDAYRRQTLARFANPYVRDTLARLATDGADRMATFLLPVLRERLARGERSPWTVAVVAAWARYLQLATAPGGRLPFTDRRAGALAAIVGDPADDALRFLARDAGMPGDAATEAEFREDLRLLQAEPDVRLALVSIGRRASRSTEAAR
jgi:mannitol 2-dehydrogenase